MVQVSFITRAVSSGDASVAARHNTVFPATSSAIALIPFGVIFMQVRSLATRQPVRLYLKPTAEPIAIGKRKSAIENVGEAPRSGLRCVNADAAVESSHIVTCRVRIQHLTAYVLRYRILTRPNPWAAQKYFTSPIIRCVSTIHTALTPIVLDIKCRVPAEVIPTLTARNTLVIMTDKRQP